MKIWCDHCGRNVRTDNYSGTICCSPCGRVLGDATFFNTATRQARMAGNNVKSTPPDYTESQKRALAEEHYGLKSRSKMYAQRGDGDDCISGHRFLRHECSSCAMVKWCSHCGTNVRTADNRGRIWCSLCGKVLADDTFVEEATYVNKEANGQVNVYINTDDEEKTRKKKKMKNSNTTVWKEMNREHTTFCSTLPFP